MSENSPLSERMRRQVDRLLDEADGAARDLDWQIVRARARAALAADSADRDEARSHLDIALPELQAMKMQPSLERALPLRARRES